MAQPLKIIVKPRSIPLRPAHLCFILTALIPVIWVVFLSVYAHNRGSENFDFTITRHGLVSLHQLDHVNKDDLIKTLWGIPTHQVLNYHLANPEQSIQPGQITIKRDSEPVAATLITRRLSFSDIFRRAWSHYFLVGVLVVCSLAAALFAPPGQPVLPFFSTFIASAVINSTDLIYQFGFSDPRFISTAYLTIITANWIMFSSWAHFSLNFPVGHQLAINRPAVIAALYAVPPLVSFAVALSAAGSSYEFWFWIHKIRRLFVPIVIIGSYIKMVVDFRRTPSPIVRNQLKYPLVSFWFGIGPYLFLFVIPILISGSPVLEYKWVIILSPLLPASFLLAMIQYRMMDVDETISKGMAYVILVGGFYASYASILYLTGAAIGVGTSSWIVFAFILVVGFIFSPAKESIRLTIDRLFFKEKLEFAPIVQMLSQKITHAFQLSDLADVVVHDLPDRFRLEKACLVVLYNQNQLIFPEPAQSDFRSWPPQVIAAGLTRHDAPLICQGEYHDPELRQELETLEDAGYHLIIGLKSGRRMQGMICIGLNAGRLLFSGKQLHALTTLSNQITLALENAMRYEALKKSTQDMKELHEKMARNESLAAIGEMTSVLAHEIKTPLAVISSSAQHLSTQPEDRAVVSEMIDYITSEIKHMADLVDNLLGVAKYRPPEFKYFNLVDEVKSAIARWKQGKDHRSNIRIAHTLPDSAIPIMGDPKQLGQVIDNLIRNSEDAMPDGGMIRIDIEDSPKSDPDNVVLQITDTGPGIAETHMPRLFNKFFSTKKNGLGFGLFLCKQIIQAHNGSIKIENMPSTGLLVHIRLPRQPYPGRVR